jgi:hypothetical protein
VAIAFLPFVGVPVRRATGVAEELSPTPVDQDSAWPEASHLDELRADLEFAHLEGAITDVDHS